MILVSKKKKRIISIVLMILIIFFTFTSNQKINVLAETDSLKNTNEINYTSHTSILIDSDEDFDSAGFPGSGTENDPYIIENYQIASRYSSAIEIGFTTKYFIIRDCLLENSATGVYIMNIASNTAIIADNIFNQNDVALYVYSTEYTRIENNTFQVNKYAGIQLEYSPFSTIGNNTFTQTGISLWYDMGLSDFQSLNVYNNYVNEKPILWYKDQTALSFTTSDYAQIFLINCDDIEIRDLVSTVKAKGICLYYCSNATIIENECGIEIVGGDMFTIENNRFSDSDLTVFTSTNIIIDGNKYKNGGFGIYVYEYSNNIIIRNNLCKGRTIGIYIDMSSYCIIENNTCSYCFENGIYIPFSDHILIRNNKIFGNNFYGVNIIETSFCEIYQNIIYDNGDYGITLADWGGSSDNNAIYRNIFIDNNPSYCQAYDDGINNVWYNTSTLEGNYWNDYIGSGNYSTDGAAGSADIYPLSDTDEDELPVEWEVDNNLDPWKDDSTEDPDDDTLTNLEEFNLQTNPRNNDTDADGLSDGDEVLIHLTDPNNSDTDADGLSDGDEVLIHLTDPNNNDTDADGLSDGEEVENEYDPLDPKSPKKAVFEFYVIMIAFVAISVYIWKKKR